MPEWLTEFFASNPSYSYVAIGSVFLLCGIGLPIPEEITLVFAGYLCYQKHAVLWAMIVVSSTAILLGDVLPFLLGRLFGPRILRLRWVRFVINRQRLAVFDRWFRKRGDLVILIARFIPGLRVVAFFTGGTMRMRWSRFLFLDTCGISLTAPVFIFLGWHFGDKIKETFEWINRIEDGLLYLAVGTGLVVAVWYWLRQRAKQRATSGPRDSFVEPSPVESKPEAPASPASPPASGAANGTDPATLHPPLPRPERGPIPGEEREGSGSKPGAAEGSKPSGDEGRGPAGTAE